MVWSSCGLPPRRRIASTRPGKINDAARAIAERKFPIAKVVAGVSAPGYSSHVEPEIISADASQLRREIRSNTVELNAREFFVTLSFDNDRRNGVTVGMAETNPER